MLERNRDAIRKEEAARLERVAKRGLLRKIGVRFGGRKAIEIPQFTEIFSVSVERCFIPLDFNEEHPVYILDVGGVLLILFGQWLYDPHTLKAPRDFFESWACEDCFFSKFSLRCSEKHGVVLELRTQGICFVKAERLNIPINFKRLREYELCPGHSETIFQDLVKANLVIN